MSERTPLVTPRPETLADLLRLRAQERPDDLAYRFLVTGEVDGPHATRTFGELDDRARAIGAWLQAEGSMGERALLLYEPGIDFLDGFFGAELGGMVPVPAYPPDPTRLERSLPRLRSILADCTPRFVLTTRRMLDLAETMFPFSPDLAALRWVATDEIATSLASRWRDFTPAVGDIAFLQYTSGSTGDAKGVMVTHRNICSNLEIIADVTALRGSIRMVSWLPQYHDLGLIGALLQPLHAGGECTFFSPLDFLTRPARWLRAITRFQANVSGGPNFAYDLCVRKISESDKRDLDLSSWKVAVNGAEPTRPDTMERFRAAFEARGFRASAHAPSYGLAEATLMVAGTPTGTGAHVHAFDPDAMRRGRALLAATGVPLASVGSVNGEQRVLVVDPERRMPLADGEIGEIWIAGPSVAPGYWQRPELNAEVFGAHLEDSGEGPFLRSGDLGFFRDGQLFISGRRKDVLIVRGQNHHPQDLEHSAQRAHPSIRPGCVAAFALERGGVESVGLVAEIDVRQRGEPDSVLAALRQAVAEAHDIQLSAIWLLAPGTLPKTSSGKLQRFACREGVARRTLAALHAWEAAAPPDAAERVSPSLEEDDDGEGEAGAIRSFLKTWISVDLDLERSRIDSRVPLAQYGLDSVMAIELTHALEERLGRALSPSLAWTYPTIHELANHLANPPLSETPTLRLRVDATATRDEYPISIFERELYDLIQRQPQHEVYTVFIPLRAARALDAGALERAFEALLRRQDNLRTSFHEVEGQPVRRIHAHVPFALESEDLTSLTEPERQEAIARACQEVRRIRLDRTQPPLLAARLLRVSAQESLLLFLVDHLVADAWGMGLIHRELTILYEAELRGVEAEFPQLTVRACDYAVAADDFIREALPLGKASYPDYPAADFRLPTDRPRPETPSLQVARHRIRLDDGLRERLGVAERAHGFSLSLACLVAFQVALHRVTQREEVLFAAVFDNRRVRAMRDVVAHMIYREMFHGDVRTSPSYLTLLGRARRFALEDRLREQPRVILTQPPAMRVVINFHHYEAASHSAPPLFVPAVEHLAFPYLWDIVDLSLQIFPTAQGVICSTIYRNELYDEATIQRLSSEFVRSLEEIASDPSATLRLGS